MTRSSPSVTAFHLLQLVIFTFVFGVPTALIAGLYTWADGSWIRFLVLVVAAPVWLATYALACGVASLPFTSAVKPGTFPRDLADAAYRGRRLYGLCWTCLYYLSAAYHLVLAFPVLKWAVFRLFGYRGTMKFTLYPDTWIRDLPLLRFGEGAYISNKATLGTNMPLMDGRILVDKVTVGAGAYVGHLAMMACGTSLGDRSETGSGGIMGIRARIGNDVSTATAPVLLDHQARVSDGATIGAWSYVGKRALVGEGVKLPECTAVPRARKVLNADALVGLGSRQTPVPPPSPQAASNSPMSGAENS